MTNLEHFLRLARAGRHSGCSNGEHCAFIIGYEVADKACQMDESAVEGLIEFIRSAAINPHTARDLIDSRPKRG